VVVVEVVGGGVVEVVVELVVEVVVEVEVVGRVDGSTASDAIIEASVVLLVSGRSDLALWSSVTTIKRGLGVVGFIIGACWSKFTLDGVSGRGSRGRGVVVVVER